MEEVNNKQWEMWSTKSVEIYCYNNNTKYSSMNDAAKKLELHHHGVRRVVKGLNRKCKGYVFAAIDETNNPQPLGKAKEYLESKNYNV